VEFLSQESQCECQGNIGTVEKKCVLAVDHNLPDKGLQPKISQLVGKVCKHQRHFKTSYNLIDVKACVFVQYFANSIFCWIST
jgi:hypothetical protein